MFNPGLMIPNLVRRSFLSLFVAGSAIAASEEPSLVERVNAYWDSQKISDVATAWSLEQTRRTGASNPYLYYRSHVKQPQVIDYEIVDIKLSDREAVVKVKTLFVLPIADRGIVKQRLLKDRWIFDEGEWWHQPETSRAPSEAGTEASQAETR